MDDRRVGRAMCRAIALATGLAITLNALPADRADPPATMNGWSESEFVHAAIDNDIPESVAEEAWGNPVAMAGIPVVMGTYSESTRLGVVSAEPRSYESDAVRVAAAAGSAWASCLRYSKNWLGTVIRQLRVQTNYSYSGATITSWNTRVYPTSAIGWVFAGVVASNDYFSAVGTSAKAHHTSYRMGRFDYATQIGGSTNLWVKTTVYAPAGYSCSSGGE
jgi:hypothetical protein